MTRHHPDTLTLMEFSAGNLSEPHALCIRLHLDQCPHCRSRVDTLDSLGAVMMESQPQVGVSSDMFDAILSRIDSEPDMTETYISTQAKRMSPLQKLLGDDLNSLPWKRQLGDVSVLDISERFPGQSEQVVLQKLAAGGKAPAHTHRGSETTIVLQGAFSDQKGVFNQWDFVVLNQEDEHKPVAVGCEDCITLSVLSAPVKLTGTFTRLLNPFIR
ncbi:MULTISPECIES: ChrR family anti-sigma-E factor [Marinobacter]|jgi:putative transcriptional regulator|uniref:Anti-ECF sigma factor ChrR n=1 Tax=Marinobacter salarius TaxID=1420917 RepID=W5YP01_9GAMM|nr:MULTISPECIES: ChrR family anti-sigma-E factor [Marinobacter]AHI30780.1 anti-ECF sigma factor ChrR [Marinobacter salarius]ARM85673.1 anti-sigma-E factor ChrR [Marinobacter salarius]AZR40537.1 anti-sigma-E factor ChrR [Marinobacter salarius]KXJ42815.1 MAG: anti-sigma factor [Marinobacter sp. Hex_13]MBJ7301079.1 cupin domain-containing protein [Marinobacter salarius]|mmetsp:Transcript_27990/g.45950  ORF Transcript_27990/g.45950 Transcript_27990/m.45950 type:complete len:215 (-) Transcript_27990:9-653(-)